ncbi:hypothetical protein HN537_08470 [bacterium]|jgi:hypothetical protein|nr:hypothetical protein [bacterium]
MRNILLVMISTSVLVSQSNQQSEILSETPLHPIPKEMTFEEYQDMNRRMSIGVGLAFIPIPGMIHRYAGEKTIATKLTYISLGGLASLIASMSNNIEKKEWRDSDYEILIMNQGLENETRFEKIPLEITGNDSIRYKLNQVYEYVSYSGGAPALGALGLIAIVGSYYYDVYHGLKMIHDKREKVRFKYGKKMKFAFRPSYDVFASKAKLNLDINF